MCRRFFFLILPVSCPSHTSPAPPPLNSYSSQSSEPFSLGEAKALGTQSFSFSAWVQPRARAYAVLMSKQDCHTTANMLRLELHADGRLALVTDELLERTPASASPASPDANGWHPEFVAPDALPINRYSFVVLSRAELTEANQPPRFKWTLAVDGKTAKTAVVPAHLHMAVGAMRVGAARKCVDGEAVEDQRMSFKGEIRGATLLLGRTLGEGEVRTMFKMKPDGV